MKYTKKKLIQVFVVLFFSCIHLSPTAAKKNNKQIHQVVDQRGVFDTTLQTVVYRNPTVTSLNRGGNFRMAPYGQSVDFENSNTSNLPNVGYLGNTAEIVDPHIVIERNTPISAIKNTPAHIGNRNEKQTITSYNLDNGKIESHTLNKQIPIYGTIQQVEPLNKKDVVSYNLKNNNFERARSVIQQ